MNFYKTSILLILCGLCGPISANATDSLPPENEVSVAEDQPPLAWIGPGYYNNAWFDTEEDYNNYLSRSNHDRHHDKHHHKEHKDHHKDKKKDHHKDKKKHHGKKHHK